MNQTAIIEYDKDLYKPIKTLQAPLALTDFIRSSPYHEQEHLLDLRNLQPQYIALSLALQSFEPINGEQDYAFVDYQKAFNIEQVILQYRKYADFLSVNIDRKFSVYVIAFRSALHHEIQASARKRLELATIDKYSHRDANLSGGLLKYWYGTPDNVYARNLATCWWRNKEDAKKGGGGKAHREGMAKVKSWFSYWQVEEYELIITQHDYRFVKLS